MVSKLLPGSTILWFCDFEESEISSEKEKIGPWYLGAGWYYNRGPGVLLLNTSSYIEHHHQTRPFCDCNGERQKQDHSTITSEQTKKMLTFSKPQKWQNIPYPGSGGWLLVLYQLQLHSSLPSRQDLLKYPILDLSLLPDSMQSPLPLDPPPIISHEPQLFKFFLTFSLKHLTDLICNEKQT